MGTRFTVTSDYGMRQHPIRGGMRFHAGIDFAAPRETRARTVRGGRVLRVGDTDPNGYGLVVAVETPTGEVETFSHLNSAAVAVGDVIQPGAAIGGVGRSGGSTGDHLHFEVWKSADVIYQNAQANTINPRTYLQTTRTATPTPRGTGPAPTAPASAIGDTLPMAQNFTELYYEVFRFGNGRINTQNSTSAPTRSINNTSPLSSPTLAYHRNAYPAGQRNNAEHNFSYEAVANDRSYRLAIHRVSASLNIPSVWLADVIDFETGGTHAPATTNPLGCIGLIQACPSGMLGDLAQKWGTNVTRAGQRLGSMSRAEYLEETRWWIAKYSENGRLLNTVEDLYALVNGGPGALRRRDRSGLNDRNVVNGRVIGGSFQGHVANLGARAGRRYTNDSRAVASSRRGNVHSAYVTGCQQCARMARQTGTITPHEGTR